MTIDQMRRADYFGGIFLCFLLTHLDKIKKLFGRKRVVKKHSILVVKCWGVGSIILAIDAFCKIRESYPNSRISVLTLNQNRQIYEMINLFDEIIDIDVKSWISFFYTLIRSVINIRKSSFDIAFDFEFTSRFSTIMTYLSSGSERIGFRYEGVWRGNLYTKEVIFREGTKIKQSFFELINDSRHLYAAPKHINLSISSKDMAIIENILDKEGSIYKNPLVGFNINASELCLLRRWPKEYFVELVDRLIEKYHCSIIFIGSKEDTKYVIQSIKPIKNRQSIHNISGFTTLPQLAYLIGKFKLFITNDSGPLHLAVYLDIPTVSFFGPETPLLYGPQGDKHSVFYKQVNCSPCIHIKNYKYHRCLNDNICLKKISPDEVMDEIERKRIL